MMRSLLDVELPPLPEAEERLATLRRQERARLAGAFILTVLAGAAVPVSAELWPALGAGAVAAVATGAAAFDRRHALLTALLRVREAYRLDAVRVAGVRFASLARRRRLAAWLRKVVRLAEGDDGAVGYDAGALDDRVLARRERLLALAEALESPSRDVHPASVALIHCLLTRPPSSPLYNPGIDADVLDLALHRAEAGIAA